MIPLEKKIIGIGALKKKLSALREAGRIIAFTNGCFDLMHLGHVRYLQKAKKGNRVLVVGLNSDQSIRRIKGPSRPVIGQKSRAAVLAALESVDFVVIFNQNTPYDLIKAIRPDILIKGADWKGRKIVGTDMAGKVELIAYIRGFSTTRIMAKIKKHG
ncbi:MAG: adenylyltransferase/cytidyltransferase family protein [Candidatus Omnitrophica bacterium]|nr:adenylyltransferase/cytidyltransferase family protein [Candidatus Omnitrophota bacterium]